MAPTGHASAGRGTIVEGIVGLDGAEQVRPGRSGDACVVEGHLGVRSQFLMRHRVEGSDEPLEVVELSVGPRGGGDTIGGAPVVGTRRDVGVLQVLVRSAHELERTEVAGFVHIPGLLEDGAQGQEGLGVERPGGGG
jgi:hypothetical protein